MLTFKRYTVKKIKGNGDIYADQTQKNTQEMPTI